MTDIRDSPPDLSRLRDALGAKDHGPGCARSRVAVLASESAPASFALPACTCGLSSARERAERIEGMAMDAGKKAN